LRPLPKSPSTSSSGVTHQNHHGGRASVGSIGSLVLFLHHPTNNDGRGKPASAVTSRKAESTSDPLLDLANYLDAVTYFSLLQDHGSMPMAKQTQIMKDKPKSKVPKWRKFADKLFQGLYELRLKLYDHYKLRPGINSSLTTDPMLFMHSACSLCRGGILGLGRW
jgi:hypothetical protein